MSEEQQMAEELGIDPEALEQEEGQEEEQEDQEGEEQGEEEQEQEKELPKGFMSKEAWIEAGKDPDEWVSPEVFKERTQRIQAEGRLKRELKQQQEEFESRLKNLNLLSQAQLKRQREELLSRRDDLIEVADKDGVRKIDKELKDLDAHDSLVAEKEDQQANKPPEVIEWEEENSWCMDPEDPRTPIVQKAFADALKQGKTTAGALRAADKAVASYKPEGEKREKKPPTQMADSSKSVASTRNDGPTLTWNQLSGEEVTMFEEFFESTGMTKKDYLKTVADQRKGA